MKKSKGSTKEQMNKCMNEWMNEKMIMGEGGVSRQGLKGISNVHGKLLSKMVRVFFPPNWWDDKRAHLDDGPMIFPTPYL